MRTIKRLWPEFATEEGRIVGMTIFLTSMLLTAMDVWYRIAVRQITSNASVMQWKTFNTSVWGHA